jgi:hypothetical protein
MFDPGPFFALFPYRENPPEPRAIGVNDTSGYFLRFITPSYKSHGFWRIVVPRMFVHILARASKGKAFT